MYETAAAAIQAAFPEWTKTRMAQEMGEPRPRWGRLIRGHRPPGWRKLTGWLHAIARMWGAPATLRITVSPDGVVSVELE